MSPSLSSFFLSSPFLSLLRSLSFFFLCVANDLVFWFPKALLLCDCVSLLSKIRRPAMSCIVPYTYTCTSICYIHVAHGERERVACLPSLSRTHTPHTHAHYLSGFCSTHTHTHTHTEGGEPTTACFFFVVLHALALVKNLHYPVPP